MCSTFSVGNRPYQRLNKVPKNRLTRRLPEKLWTLKRSGHVSKAVYNKIRPQRKQPRRIYGLPNIHKADIPFRPIASYVNNFTHELSAYLDDILSPRTGNADLQSPHQPTRPIASKSTTSQEMVALVFPATVLDSFVGITLSSHCLQSYFPLFLLAVGITLG